MTTKLDETSMERAVNVIDGLARHHTIGGVLAGMVEYCRQRAEDVYASAASRATWRVYARELAQAVREIDAELDRCGL